MTCPQPHLALGDLRAVVCYTAGQSSCGAGTDGDFIVSTLRGGGLDARIVDLVDVHIDPAGELLERDPATGELRPWVDPHVVLMYHGAIAPEGAVAKLRAMRERGSAVVNGPEAWPYFTDKRAFAQYMGPRGVPVIDSHDAVDADELRAAFAAIGGPVVIKKPISTEGDDIHVAHTADDVERVAGLLRELGPVIVQPVIDSTIGDDIEPAVAAVLLDSEWGRRHEFRINTARFADGSISVDACYMRVAPDSEQVVNNVAQGARPIRVPFDGLHPDDQTAILRAAEQAPPSGDLIGWDFIGQPGSRRVIEGNSGSGLPTGEEGIQPGEVVGSYVRVLREAGEASVLRGGLTRAGAGRTASAPAHR